MKHHAAWLIPFPLALAIGCGPGHAPPTEAQAPTDSAGGTVAALGAEPGPAQPSVVSDGDPARQRQGANEATDALVSGSFERAEKTAAQVVGADPHNAHAQLVLAVARYRNAMRQLNTDVRTVLIAGVESGGFNHRYMRSSLEQTVKALDQVDEGLAVAATESAISLELCLACWEVDWNRNRRIDDADRLLFQIEQDANGKSIPENDPRRKPTFRFDHGDVLWARAFVSFQRALLELILAYEWKALDDVLASLDRGKDLRKVVIRLKDPKGVARARQLILDGLAFSNQCRQSYLAETDDEREWVPNPRQRNHPLPLPVDKALYDTWEGVVGDLQRLLRSEEGLSVAELAQLGDHKWTNPPRGYLDLGSMLSNPKDIVIDVNKLETAVERRRGNRKHVEAVLRSVLGVHYKQQMQPTPLIRRLSRMKGEVERGEESLERKLRYLFWIN